MAFEGYDVQQVCLNGHQITDGAMSMPQFRKAFCPECGERTIMECPECRAPILGHYDTPGFISTRSEPVPNNCHACGTAYPWRQSAIAAAIEVLGIELQGEAVGEAVGLIPAVVAESPRTAVAALKLKRILGTLGKPAYDVTIKVVSDVLSETAKKTLGLK